MIDPALQQYVDDIRANPAPHPSTVDIQRRRAAYREGATALWPEPVALAEVRECALDLPGRTVAGRLYVPTADESRGFVLYFHGGSFVVGDLETHDGVCRRLAVDTGMRFLAIDYRLAPEHPFPAGLDDVVEALRYVAGHRAEFGDPGATLFVMGDSAGATLATVAATLTRHEGLGVGAQVLLYPTLGPEMLTDSAHDYGTGFWLELDHLRYDYGQYLAGADHTDPRVSPLLGTDLADSPPAIVVVASCDPLRDEAVAYAGLLERYGVPVELLEAKGMIHGFIRLGGTFPEALAIVDDLAEHMHRLVERS